MEIYNYHIQIFIKKLLPLMIAEEVVKMVIKDNKGDGILD